MADLLEERYGGTHGPVQIRLSTNPGLKFKEAVKSLAGSGFCLHFEQNVFIKYERFSQYLAFLKLTNTFKWV